MRPVYVCIFSSGALMTDHWFPTATQARRWLDRNGYPDSDDSILKINPRREPKHQGGQ